MNWIVSLVQRLNLSAGLRSVYFWFFPISTKRYQIAHRMIRNYLIHFRPLNIQYQKWIQANDSYSPIALSAFKNNVALFTENPLISIIMPVYNPNLEFLSQAIQSVIGQIYPYWELCIADDASTQPEVKKVIQGFADQDNRIKIVFRDTNGHISAASNSALELATGEYVALLDHDDKLHHLALYYVVEAVNRNQNIEVIYSDEDKIINSGKRIEPYFKSDFDEELFFSQNMVSHLGVYRTKTIRDVGGFRIGFEGSQDYDLMLRVLERIKPTEIYHISRVLYHWRISKHSVAESVGVKPYAFNAGKKALQNHLENRRIKATVKPYQNFGYQVLYEVPAVKPWVEVFFHHSKADSVPENYVQSFLSSTNYENISINGIKRKERETGRIKAERICQTNIKEKNFAQGIKELTNSYVKASNAEIIVIIHPYIISFSDQWLESLVGLLYKPGIGAVSPQLIGKNGKIFSSGVILGTQVLARHIFNGIPKSGPDTYFGWANLIKGYSALPAGCILVKRENYLEVGGLNQSLSNETVQIIDLCLKLKQNGLRNVVIPSVTVTIDPAKLSPSTNEDLIENQFDRKYFSTHWSNWLEHDPAFNPNLTLRFGKPTISNNPISNTN